MCAGKINDKNEHSSTGGCCEGMAEMMKDCCPGGAGDSDCFARMKEMKEKYYDQKTDGAAKEESRGCCG